MILKRIKDRCLHVSFFCSDRFYSYFQVKSKIESAKPTPRIAPTKTWRKNAIENKENNIGKNTKNTNKINTKRQHEKKNDKTTDYGLTAEEEELFDGIDEDELIELAGEFSGRSRTAATSKMERFVIIVNGWKLLTIITKCSILDVATVLDPSLEFSKLLFECVFIILRTKVKVPGCVPIISSHFLFLFSLYSHLLGTFMFLSM